MLNCIPSIDIIYYFEGLILAVLDMKILIHPHYEMVFEGTLYELVE